MASLENTSKQRLDMAHGFMKSVIRNQIDRDNYDKEVRQKQDKKPSKSQSTKQKKPELQTYAPPQRAKKEKSQPLYILEYKHEDGEIFSVDISKNDLPNIVASNIGSRFDLTQEFVEVLALRIEDEMNHRRCLPS